ncbi:MAG: hypothetical protein HC866_04715 [Leptolyngbyaceae cyanobacterium RU_5_1]|nr:hypothetical protein [Leptolyngbyaceae cyanobacterium RU_5_1]
MLGWQPPQTSRTQGTVASPEPPPKGAIGLVQKTLVHLSWEAAPQFLPIQLNPLRGVWGS